jgi:hypothetical protein
MYKPVSMPEKISKIIFGLVIVAIPFASLIAKTCP